MPYKHLTPVEVAIAVAKDGVRLERPPRLAPDLHQLMMLAWHVDPAQRPTMSLFEQKLRELAKRPEVQHEDSSGDD